MRVSLWTLGILLVILVVLAGLSTWLCGDTARLFVQEAQTMEALLHEGDWEGLQENLSQVQARWKEREQWLQLVIRHRETDDVNLALDKLQTGIVLQDKSLSLWAISEFRENCRHLYHRDDLSLTNII